MEYLHDVILAWFSFKKEIPKCRVINAFSLNLDSDIIHLLFTIKTKVVLTNTENVDKSYGKSSGK